MNTGEKIAKLRKTNNLTQEQLADLLNVSRQAVSKWESDGAYPETDKLIHMARIFHCSIDYLLNTEQTEKKPEVLADQVVQTEPNPKRNQSITKKEGFFPLVWAIATFLLFHLFFLFPVLYMVVNQYPIFNGQITLKLNMYQLLFTSNYQLGNIIILITYLFVLASVGLGIMIYFHPQDKKSYQRRNITVIIGTVLWGLVFFFLLENMLVGLFFILLLSIANLLGVLFLPKNKLQANPETTI